MKRTHSCTANQLPHSIFLQKAAAFESLFSTERKNVKIAFQALDSALFFASSE